MPLIGSVCTIAFVVVSALNKFSSVENQTTDAVADIGKAKTIQAKAAQNMRVI